MGESVVRVARDGDMAAVREVASAFALLDDWTGTTDFLDAERAFGTLLVGEADGRIAGFGGALRRGGLTHLGDLFVLPAHQSSGVGREILRRLLPVDAPRVTFASSDPRALALYVRQGMRPVCPLLYLTGPSADGPRDDLHEAAGDVEEASSLDARVSGGDRSEPLAWYAGVPGVSLHTTAGGYAFARRAAGSLEVGPAGGETPHDCVEAVRAAVAAHPGAGRVRVAVPGVHPLLPLLLEDGWRIGDMDTFMATDPGLVRLDRYVPHPDLG
ncbi:GNAT family N-acetyltransferase [Microbispora sp. ATCC PTA-5024]|uniref:GNAT family N-acetyltransferase n=1 Tax=Microbispora sp. ATCC PTA-5024 TaxID=316330 RepID=UPI0003DCEB9D|nr:GNAT family N-acetyltransferase [Microbispora sp. ATCC PTA-5024]ETK30856.1 hypothetical protein MPTA5024_37995 [Microbispora sp. ATCC PTA-5024]